MKTDESWLTTHLFLLSSHRRAARPHLVSGPARQRPALGACVAVLIAALAGCGGRSVGATETEEPRDAASGADVADCGATGNADASRMAACSLAYDPGPCNAFIPVFAFVNGKCSKQIYGGCGGNGNRFSSLAECLGQCERSASCGCPDGRVLGQACVECGPSGGCARLADICGKTCATNSECSEDMGSCSDRVCTIVVCR